MLTNAGKELADKKLTPPAKARAQAEALGVSTANALPVDALLAGIKASLARLAKLDTVTPDQVSEIAAIAADVVKQVTARAKMNARMKDAGKVAPVVAAKAKGKGKSDTVTAH
jgi:hypothetical protein